MALLRFFKTPKHSRFDYIPQYWDPKKEDLEERLRLAQKDGQNDPERMKARISAGMRRGYASNPKARSNYLFRSNMLLLGIVIILLILTYLFLTHYLPGIVEALDGNQSI